MITPQPLSSRVRQGGLELEVAYCVGGVLSPLLANIALSVLDEHFTAAWEGFGPPWTRKKRTRKGLATWRLVRYADDFVVLVKGTRAHAQALREQAAAVLAPMGLGLSAAKTRITHIDEGFDFLVATRGRMVRVGSLNGGLSVMTA
jgi:RNA-directed DNA polymerase